MPKTHYYIHALDRVFGFPFCRPRDIVQVRGASQAVSEFNDWVVHARFLLTRMNDKMMEEWMQGEDPHDEGLKVSKCVIIGLQKNYQYLDYVVQQLRECRFGRYLPTFAGCLLLFEDPTLRFYFEVLKERDDHYAPVLYDRCAQLLHEGFLLHEIGHAIPRGSQVPQLDRFLWTARILRAGLTFHNLQQFRNALVDLLMDTTPPHQLWLKKHEDILFNRAKREEIWEKSSAEQDSLIHEYKAGHPLNSPIPQVQPTTMDFHDAVRSYLSQPNPELLETLPGKIAASNNYIDLLAGLEMDLDYTLPMLMVEQAYKQLCFLIHPSYPLLEQYATDLLLRGQALDTKAKELYWRAQTIKKKYVWEEYYDNRWVMYGADRSC